MKVGFNYSTNKEYFIGHGFYNHLELLSPN